MGKVSDPNLNSRHVPAQAIRRAGYWLLGACLASTLLVACSFAPSRTIIRQDSFSVGDSAQLRVTSENGGVSVRGAAEVSGIQVSATIKNPDRVLYQARQEGDTVLITATTEKRFRLFGGNAGTTIEVLVPLATDLVLRTSNGRISVAGANGMVSAVTSNGGIRIEEVNGDVEARTSNGGIEISQVSGQVQAESSNGSVRLAADLPSRSENRLKTSNGSVTVTLLNSTGVNLSATTRNGSVSTDLPITSTAVQERTRLEGTIGDGGADLDIQTSNGNITIQ